MNLRTFVIFSSILYQLSYITNDYGYSKVWYYTNSWSGVKGTTYNYAINFRKAFQNIPLVIVSPFIVANYLLSTASYGYKLEITSITTTNFQVILSLDYNNIANLCFSWVAFDDQRYYVIHQFNQGNPQTKTIPHTFTSALDGIIFFTKKKYQVSQLKTHLILLLMQNVNLFYIKY